MSFIASILIGVYLNRRFSKNGELQKKNRFLLDAFNVSVMENTSNTEQLKTNKNMGAVDSICMHTYKLMV